MNSGCYQLKIKIKRDIQIEIGALGLCGFRKGRYVYTGSAMKNLSARIARHKRKDKKMHWHIDYLLNHKDVELIDVNSYFSEIKEECQYNQLLVKQGAEIPVAGFGSSDCNKCPSHLVKIDSINSGLAK